MTVRPMILSRVLPALALAAIAISGCTKQSRVAPRAVDRPIVVRDLPDVLSNTVGAFGQINGLQPTYASGYGIVVGLDGTGSGDIPLSVRAQLITEMTRYGVGRTGGPLEDVTPDEMIDDPNTAVVLVQALIPPAAPRGFTFDVRVSAIPGGSTTSLEGGTLYTTELRRGTAIPGGPDTFEIATAKGQLLINPLADPAAPADSPDGVVRTEARILGGGTMQSPFRPTFRLDNPSHARARAIVAAVNARFPQRNNRFTTARGINEDSVEINVPAEYMDDPAHFFQLVLHTRVDQSFTNDWAEAYIEALEAEPGLSAPLGYALEAIGKPSIPYLRRLYDSPLREPRLAALRVGASLADPLTREHLERLAMDSNANQRNDAIRLIARLPFDRRIDLFLTELLNDEDLTVRITAYEALSTRSQQTVQKYVFPGSFDLHLVPSKHPMVYFTQQDQAKLVLFGDLPLNENVFASGWDSRLMVDTSENAGSGRARVFFQDAATGRTSTEMVGRSVTELVAYFASTRSLDNPDPGLSMTYSETVGSLHQLMQSGAFEADFVAENDKLQLEFLRAAEAGDVVSRPEFSEEGAVDSLERWGSDIEAATLNYEGRDRRARTTDKEWDERRRRYVVPGPARQETPAEPGIDDAPEPGERPGR